MNNNKDIDQILERFIAAERNTVSNPCLSTRVMATINKKRGGEVLDISPLWRTAMVAASLMISVLTGIATGNLYQSNSEGSDIVFLTNDNSMESFSIYNQIGNE